MPDRYRKLVIHTLNGDFRGSTGVVEEPWRDPGPGEVAIRNHYAGCNAIFDKNLCRNTIRYVDVRPPFDMGIESVGRVVAVGPGVEGLHEGDAVAASRLGSGYREYQIAQASRVLRVEAPTPEILALIPTGISALVGLEKVGELAIERSRFGTGALESLDQRLEGLLESTLDLPLQQDCGASGGGLGGSDSSRGLSASAEDLLGGFSETQDMAAS